jgi:hypothetical protein
MLINHPNLSHQTTVNAAEQTRAAAVAAAIAAGGANVQANVRAIEATFWRAVIASCQINGVPGEAQFRQSLHDVAGVWS